MSKLLPSLAVAISLGVLPLASANPANADDLATVTIGDAFAQALSAATHIPVRKLPDSIEVSTADATVVCGAPVLAGETCVGSTSPETLVAYLDNDHSAKALAPGHLKGDGESARSYAPGQTKADGPSADHSAKAFAPGHVKGEDESAKTLAPGHTKQDGANASGNAAGLLKGGKGPH